MHRQESGQVSELPLAERTLQGAEGRSQPLDLRDATGDVVCGDGGRWLGPAAAADERLLDRVIPPVIDVGCGPGRHVLALSRRGVSAVGLDLTPFVVRLARSRGARVISGSIFETLPGEGIWGTALLLDGNIGIGGDPEALLRRLATLVRPGGRLLVELDPTAGATAIDRVRMTFGTSTGPWFKWPAVGAASIDSLARNVGLHVAETWFEGQRWFAQIDAPPHGWERRSRDLRRSVCADCRRWTNLTITRTPRSPSPTPPSTSVRS